MPEHIVNTLDIELGRVVARGHNHSASFLDVIHMSSRCVNSVMSFCRRAVDVGNEDVAGTTRITGHDDENEQKNIVVIRV